MQRYDTYKDSGVKWLGEIPSHWEVKRLASYFTERRVKVSDKEYEPLSVTKLGVFPQWENVAKTNDGDNRKLVKKGDFVINSRSDRKGSSGVADRDGSVSLINIVLKPRNTIRADFSNYLLKSYKFIEEYYRNGRGIVADLWTTRYDEMKMIKLALPPLEEQTAIANYLDVATAKIDAAIAQQQKMIDLLNERKQIIINRAVAKGLNPNAKMKDSGVEWIGEVPEGWDIIPLKAIISFVNGYAFDSNDFKDEGDVRVIRISNIADGTIDYEGIAFVRQNQSLCSYLTKAGDLLIAMSGATTGKVGFDNLGGAYVNQRVGIIRSDFQKWVYYWLNTSYFKEYIYLSALGSAQPNISSKGIKNFRILFPLIEDYERILENLELLCQKVDDAIGSCKNQISLLQERKQIIINEVVTGKVKVL